MKERSFMFRRRRIWFYPYLRMNVSHLKPKTIIKGFLYSRPMVGGKSYFIDFGLFKISIGTKQMTYKEWLEYQLNSVNYESNDTTFYNL